MLHSFTSETYAALTPEWQEEARRLLKQQGDLLDLADDCVDDDEAEELLQEVAQLTGELDLLARLLIN